LHTHCTIDAAQVAANEKAPTCGAFAEPSDGLEPSTPSLPCAPIGNRSQPTATVWLVLAASASDPISHRLPPVATTGLHKGSILRCQSWRHAEIFTLGNVPGASE